MDQILNGARYGTAVLVTVFLVLPAGLVLASMTLTASILFLLIVLELIAIYFNHLVTCVIS